MKISVLFAAVLALSTGSTIARPDLPPDGSPSPVSGAGQVVDIPLVGGHQRVALYLPERPRATIVMLPGGSGKVGERRDGVLEHADNFVVRSRELWMARGYAVMVADTVDDLNLRGRRSSPAYGRLVSKMVRFARSAVRRPVILLGTSQGAIAAVNGAAHAGPGEVAGVVVSEGVSIEGRSGETVFNAGPSHVRVPVLVVANAEDRCDVTPPDMAGAIAKAMVRSPDVKTIMIDGGDQRSAKECGSLSPHGYYGIERAAVAAISEWIDDTLARERR